MTINNVIEIYLCCKNLPVFMGSKSTIVVGGRERQHMLLKSCLYMSSGLLARLSTQTVNLDII